MRLVYDIETNGLLDVVHTVHSICLADVDTGKLYSFADQEGYPPIADGLKMLEEAEEIIAHNGIGYDKPATKLVYPTWHHKGKMTDTLVLSRLLFTDLLDQDFKKRKIKDRKLWGSHSLEAWGERLGIPKGDFGKQNGWENWSVEMQKYCEQDVRVLLAMVKYFDTFDYSQQAIDLEMEFQEIISVQERNGAPFDTEGATKLAKVLEKKSKELKEIIEGNIPDWEDEEIFIPKVNNKSRGYVKGEPFVKIKKTPFKASSRTQIIRLFKEKYDWQPTIFSDKGNPKVDDEVLRGLPYAEATLLADYFENQKILGQLSTGAKGWLKFVKNGRIHGRMNTIGARTRRATHSSPNLGQVPSPRAYMGSECRKLFKAPKGWKFVGCDVAGLELRMLAHYLWAWDNGAYAKEILEGDIHTANQEAAGLPTRDLAKTFIYCMLYGGGDGAIGAITNPNDPDHVQKIMGKSIRQKFMTKIPAYRRLMDAVKNAHKSRGFLLAPDKGKLLSVSEHSALNTLLQGGGAVVCKLWNIITWELIRERGLEDKVEQILQVHDEVNMIAKEGYEEEIGKCLQDAAPLAGQRLGIKIPLEAEYMVGDDWYDCH